MISLRNIDKYYKIEEESFHVLKNITLDILEKEMIAIMGPSGSGKSTLMNLLGFIDCDFEGTYLFEKEDLNDVSDKVLSKIRNENVGFVFQDFKLIENNTVFENIELPLLYGGYKLTKTGKKVMQMIKKVGLSGKEEKFPNQLSGGQKQRVAIARALINTPKFLLADEPTGALDTVTSEEILQLFNNINRTFGTTIILVTHNPEVVNYCSRYIHIRDGRITENRVIDK